MSPCHERICQPVTLLGYAEGPKVADAVIETRYGNRDTVSGNRMDVYLVDGHVVGWGVAGPSETARGRRMR